MDRFDGPTNDDDRSGGDGRRRWSGRRSGPSALTSSFVTHHHAVPNRAQNVDQSVAEDRHPGPRRGSAPTLPIEHTFANQDPGTTVPER